MYSKWIASNSSKPVVLENDIDMLVFKHAQQIRRAPDDRVDRRALHVEQRMVTDENPHLVIVGVAPGDPGSVGSSELAGCKSRSPKEGPARL